MEKNEKWELFKEEYKQLLKQEGLDKKVQPVSSGTQAKINSKKRSKPKISEREITEKQKSYLEYLIKCYDKILEEDIEEFSIIVDEIFEKDLDKLTLKEASDYISRIKLMIEVKKDIDNYIELQEKQEETNAAIAAFDNVISLDEYRNNRH